MGSHERYNQKMDISQIISANLTEWMNARPDLDTFKKLSKASGVGFGTVQRAKNGDGNITVQNLEAIAHAFKRKAIDLLVDKTELTKIQKDFRVELDGYYLAAMRGDTRASITSYKSAGKANIHTIQEPPPDERELLQGYRDASPEVREIMLDAARRAIKKHNVCQKDVSQ
jgi:transcriptional regulator with XRE-family HTH domain